VSLCFTRPLIIVVLSALVAQGVTACGASPTTPSPVPAPASPTPSSSPPPLRLPGPLVDLAALFLGDAEVPCCVAEKPDADGGYTLEAATLYTIWVKYAGSASGRCVVGKFSYSWIQPGIFGDCNTPSAVGSNFTTPGADAALDLQNLRITFVVEERGPDLPEPRTQTVEIPVRVMR
jgi:hypothetical protein